MTPAAILDYARSHGITMLADGDRLVIRADSDLPAELVEAARENKRRLLAELRLRNPGCYFDDLLPGAEAANPEHDEAIREHLEERAAIQEHDGGLTKPEAEKAARGNMRVFAYRLADNPESELILISPGSTLDDARRRLAHQFGSERVLEVREHTREGSDDGQ